MDRRTMEMNTITTNGHFDARKARQLLYEWSRDNDVVNRSTQLARHLGLSSEETYLLMSVHLLASNENLTEIVTAELVLRVPTFFTQATQSGPFDTKAEPK